MPARRSVRFSVSSIEPPSDAMPSVLPLKPPASASALSFGDSTKNGETCAMVAIEIERRAVVDARDDVVARARAAGLDLAGDRHLRGERRALAAEDLAVEAFLGEEAAGLGIEHRRERQRIAERRHEAEFAGALREGEARPIRAGPGYWRRRLRSSAATACGLVRSCLPHCGFHLVIPDRARRSSDSRS